jgi:hypothetical protein
LKKVFLFQVCSALVYKNIYIESNNLENALSLSRFTYDYDFSLFPDSNELFGSVSPDVNLREYLYSSQSRAFGLYHFFNLFIFLKKKVINVKKDVMKL